MYAAALHGTQPTLTTFQHNYPAPPQAHPNTMGQIGALAGQLWGAQQLFGAGPRKRGGLITSVTKMPSMKKMASMPKMPSLSGARMHPGLASPRRARKSMTLSKGRF